MTSVMADALQTSLQQLEEAVDETERAAEAILAEAEKLMEISDDPALQEMGMTLITSCSFNDLVGQRLAKVHALLKIFHDNRERLLVTEGAIKGIKSTATGPINKPSVGLDMEMAREAAEAAFQSTERVWD